MISEDGEIDKDGDACRWQMAREGARVGKEEGKISIRLWVGFCEVKRRNKIIGKIWKFWGFSKRNFGIFTQYFSRFVGFMSSFLRTKIKS